MFTFPPDLHITHLQGLSIASQLSVLKLAQWERHPQPPPSSSLFVGTGVPYMYWLIKGLETKVLQEMIELQVMNPEKRTV